VDIRPAVVEEVCRGADIICTATSVANGAAPVLPDRGLQPWLHVNAVGSDFPGKTELPLELLQRSLVCPDYLPQARREGECQQLPAAAIGPDLVQLVQNSTRYETHRANSTVFDSTGWALEDYVAVRIFQSLAAELQCGTELELVDLGLDPKSPYALADPVATGAGTSRRRSEVAATAFGDPAPLNPYNRAV
jgi:ornithine cyclodeaminase/alanine dehydrogenase-like protein (mu-crystallin family)